MDESAIAADFSAISARVSVGFTPQPGSFQDKPSPFMPGTDVAQPDASSEAAYTSFQFERQARECFPVIMLCVLPISTVTLPNGPEENGKGQVRIARGHR